jgi:hypothetical protein
VCVDNSEISVGKEATWYDREGAPAPVSATQFLWRAWPGRQAEAIEYSGVLEFVSDIDDLNLSVDAFEISVE